MANAQGRSCTFVIDKANEASFPEAWPDTWAVGSYDRNTWFRCEVSFSSFSHLVFKFSVTPFHRLPLGLLSSLYLTHQPFSFLAFPAFCPSLILPHSRIPTVYKDNQLVITITPTLPQLWIAYFAPYSWERHMAFIGFCQAAKDHDGTALARVEAIGTSIEQRTIDCVSVGSGPRVCWLIGRQHPGESMAEWCLQGLLERLLDPRCGLARAVRQQATIHIVPNMNPDGSVRGHLRTNAVGANLNREWNPTGDYQAPTLERSPEVYYTLQRITATGCDLFIDVHGDEELPHIFFAGTHGIPGWSDRHAELWRIFTAAQLRANPDFQIGHGETSEGFGLMSEITKGKKKWEILLASRACRRLTGLSLSYGALFPFRNQKSGYDNDLVGEANLAICADAMAHRFDCLSGTLEMPFKDTYGHEMPGEGWSPERCRQHGASMLDAIAAVLPFLRAPFPFKNGGIGDGLQPDPCNQPGYKNPPSKNVFNTGGQ